MADLQGLLNDVYDATNRALRISGSVTTSAPSGTTGLTAARFVGILSDAGPPVAGDGTFVAGDVVFDTAGQEYLCTAGGTPGTWVAVGSGRVIGGPVALATTFTQTTSATAEDIPGMSLSFTYDGRPIEMVVDGGASLSHDVTSTFRNLQLAIQRSSDSATQISALANSTCGASTFTQASSSVHVMSGPLTAWPSDSAAFVVGTSYTIKLNYTVVTGGKGRVVASTSAPLKLYVVTR